MTLGEFLRGLKRAGEDILEGFGGQGDITQRIFNVLEDEEERIFEDQEGPQSEWPKITTISYITRKDVTDTYSKPQDLIADAKTADVLQDTGQLFEQATSDTSGSVRRVQVDGQDYKLIFGTSKGYKHQEGEGTASGVTGRAAYRALSRTEDAAFGMVKNLLAEYGAGGGEIPQRQFLYMTEEGFEESLDVVFDSMVNSLEEALGR